MQKLQKFQDPELGFVRNFKGTKVYCDLTGHPDDLQITPSFLVSVIENKSTANPELWAIERFKLPVAKFQAAIYSAILEPIFEKLGAICARNNAVIFWNSKTFERIGWFPVEYYPVQTQTDILRGINALHDPSLIIRPLEWKCKRCSKEHKKVCQFCQ